MITKEIAESKTARTTQFFGEIAVSKGFLTQEQVEEALAVQRNLDTISGEKPHKRIGDILFEKGWITVEQIYNVQVAVFNQHRDDSDNL